MIERAFADRVEVLERKVETLEELPARVTALEAAVAEGFASMALQFSQLRDEMRGGFSAVRAEIREGDEETRQLRAEIREGDEETRRQLREEMHVVEARLREEMHALNQDARTHALVLHEDLIARIALLDSNGRRRASPSAPKPASARRGRPKKN